MRTVGDENEIRTLTEELGRLSGEAQSDQSEADVAANEARQTEIRARLVALGRPVG